MSGVFKVDATYATVGARVDIDNACPMVIVDTDNRVSVDSVVLKMEPRVARALARQLNKWAKLVDSVSR